MTNQNEKTTTGRHPWYGVALGGLDRLSSAGGKAVLDEKLIGGGALQVHHATFLEATIGGLLLLLRLYLPELPFRRGKRASGAPDGAGMAATRRGLFVSLTFLTIAGDKALLVLALTAIPFTVAGGIYYAIPLLVPVIWGFRSRSRGLAALVTLFAAFTVVGVVMLVQDGTPQGGNHLLGVALAVGAGACRTLFLPVTDRLIKGAGRVYTEKTIAWSMLGVGLLAGAAVALTGGLGPLLDGEVIAWAALVGLLNTALPRIIQMPARELAGDRVYAVFLAASPVIATLVGVAFVGDRLDPVQWAGFVVVTVSAAAIAYMSLNLKGQGHAPLVELYPATPQARLEDYQRKLASAHERFAETLSEIRMLEDQVARTELEVAEGELADAEQRKTQAEEKIKAAESSLLSATQRVLAARTRLERARSNVRRTRAGLSPETP